jgi:hypothetical protein
MRQGVDQRHHHRLRLIGQHCLRGGRRTLVRDVHDVEPRHQLEVLEGEADR